MANYIMDMRKHVGHEPLIMCAAAVLIYNDKGEVLLQQRTDNLCWGLFGGALELGESLEEAAKREVYEEIGLTVDNLKLLNVFSGEPTHYIYPNKDEVYIVSAVYTTSNYKGDMVIDPKETKQARFFALNEIPKDINPPDRPVIEYYKSLHG